jgi:hypothetical protein
MTGLCSILFFFCTLTEHIRVMRRSQMDGEHDDPQANLKQAVFGGTAARYAPHNRHAFPTSLHTFASNASQCDCCVYRSLTKAPLCCDDRIASFRCFVAVRNVMPYGRSKYTHSAPPCIKRIIACRARVSHGYGRVYNVGLSMPRLQEV